MSLAGRSARVSRLAINGGAPVRRDPLPTWPRFDEENAAAAADVVLSGRVNYWTGHHGPAFEEEFAEWATAPHAVTLGNGTVAPEVAPRALGIGTGDEVIVLSATREGRGDAVNVRLLVAPPTSAPRARTTTMLAPSL